MRICRLFRIATTTVFFVVTVAVAALWIRSYWRVDIASAAKSNARAWDLYSGGGSFTFSAHTPGPQDRPLDWQAMPRTLPKPFSVANLKLFRRPTTIYAPLGGSPAAIADGTFLPAPTSLAAAQPYYLSFPTSLTEWRRLGVRISYGPATLIPADDPYLWKFPRTLGSASYWSVQFDYHTPFFAAAIPTAILIFLAFLHRRARHRRVAHGLCPACGYDCRATPDRCPECGALQRA